MAYTITNLNNMTAYQNLIPQLLSCAQSAGWTVNTSNNTIQYNSSSQVYTFQYFAQSSQQYWYITTPYKTSTGATATATAQFNAPVTLYNNGTNPCYTSGSIKAYSFILKYIHTIYGTDNGSPYLVMIIETENSNFIHLYFGSLTDGPATGLNEIFSVSYKIPSNPTASTISMTANDGFYQQFMFHSTYQTYTGGVFVNNSNNAQAFRPFSQTATYRAIGGYDSGFNNYKMSCGTTAYAQSTILNPVPLLINGTTSLGVNKLMYVGTPAGIRNVNMFYLTAKQQISDGTNNWLCMPAFSLTDTSSVSYTITNGASNNPIQMPSYMFGYAYLI